jgi:small subunit ribosomal protein S6
MPFPLRKGLISIWRCDVNIYETVVIFNPSLGDDETKAIVDKLTEIVVSTGGEMLKVDVWGKKKLAYEMNKQKMGNYFMLIYKAPAATVRKLEEHFKVLEVILKFMVVKLGVKQIAALPKEISGLPVAPEEVATPAAPAEGV